MCGKEKRVLHVPWPRLVLRSFEVGAFWICGWRGQKNKACSKICASECLPGLWGPLVDGLREVLVEDGRNAFRVRHGRVSCHVTFPVSLLPPTISSPSCALAWSASSPLPWELVVPSWPTSSCSPRAGDFNVTLMMCVASSALVCLSRDRVAWEESPSRTKSPARGGPRALLSRVSFIGQVRLC